MLLSVFSTFFITVILILNNTRKVCGQSSDTCDWVGSGLLQGVTRGVQPLYLRCTQGHIKWHYPRGALRALQGRPCLNSRAASELLPILRAPHPGEKIFPHLQG
ncbi:meteorin-like protein [Trichonephila inaurata madagascariensis]|uniref:Meteorin-like protein n=1 Tax=Trichonephila inaurata madagascariensis TaxID=2747483 RepID=A0A8X6YRJ1_9ARAC|nr:meteorin-like protein [Trichonephila inaurata madagascariensis]